MKDILSSTMSPSQISGVERTVKRLKQIAVVDPDSLLDFQRKNAPEGFWVGDDEMKLAEAIGHPGKLTMPCIHRLSDSKFTDWSSMKEMVTFMSTSDQYLDAFTAVLMKMKRMNRSTSGSTGRTTSR